MQQMLNDQTFLAGISGFNFAIVVVFSIFFLLAVFLLCSWCYREKQNTGESDPLIPPKPQEPPEEIEETEKEFQRQIRTHYVTLGDNLDLESGLLSLLFSKGVISNREKQMIQAEKVDHVRNEKLLDQMLKKTELDFSKFIDALRESHQDHIARILLKDGAALPVHINIETQLSVDVKEIELALVRRFNEASLMLLQRKASLDDLEELMKTLLAEVQQKKALLTKAVPHNSIVLYFFCSSVQTLDNISREFHNGVLSQCVERLVIRHIASTSLRAGPPPAPRGFLCPSSINTDVQPVKAASRPIATVRFRVDEQEYKRCLENFPRGTGFANSITLVIYIQRSFRHWRSFKRQHDVENARSDVL